MGSHCAISVIIPVYKAEKWIGACIESILNQTFEDFEIVIMIDGSPDNSYHICSNYQERDKRIKVYQQPNCGVTSARKNAVQKAKGDYICFVDADDTLPQDSLQNLIEGSEGGIHDIVIGNLYPDITFDFETFTAEEYRKECICPTRVNYAIWGKLYKSTLIEESLFHLPREISVGEDTLMNIEISFKNTKPVKLLNKTVYNYLIHSESVMHTFKFTLEYQILYHKYRLKAIPEKERYKYEKELLKQRVEDLILVGESCGKNTWKNTEL